MMDGAAPAAIEQASKSLTEQIDTIAYDVLRGCPAIGAFTGRNERETRWALERGYIPAWKEGAIWCASKAALRQHYADQASKRIDPVELAKERAAKNLARREREPSMPAVTMDGSTPTRRRRKVVLRAGAGSTAPPS